MTEKIKRNIFLSLAKGFELPEEDLLEISPENFLLLSMGMTYNIGNNFKEHFNQMFNFLENIKNKGETLKLLKTEAYNTFYALDSRAPFYASYWLDGKVMGKTYVEIGDKYRSYGFSKNPDYKDLVDALPCELEFIALLIDREDQHQLDKFLKEHFIQWLRPFVKEVSENVSLPFYRILNSYLLDWTGYILK